MEARIVAAGFQVHLARAVDQHVLGQGEHPGQERSAPPETLNAYCTAFAIRRPLAAADPTRFEWQLEVAVSHGKIGSALLALGDGAGALAAYRAGLTIAAPLATRAPDKTEPRHQVALCRAGIGRALLARGDRAGALRELRLALSVAERLASDAENIEAKEEATRLRGLVASCCR